MSAVPTIYVAVDTAILADATLMALLVDRGVYAAGDVPERQRVTDDGARVGYVRIDGSGETNEGTFGTDGYADTLMLSIQSTSKRSGAIIYRHLRRILNDKVLPSAVLSPDSIGQVTAQLTYVEDFPDPTGTHNTIARYAASLVSIA